MGTGLVKTKKNEKLPGASERKLHFACQLIRIRDCSMFIFWLSFQDFS